VAGAAPWNLAARGLTAVFSIAFSMAVVRGLGEYEYGRYSIVQTALGFFTIIYTFGMTEALLKFVPAARGDRRGAGARVILTAVAFQFSAWLALLVVALLAGDAVDRLYAGASVGGLLALGAALGVFGLAFDTITIVYTGLYRTRAVAGATLLARAVSLGAVLFAVKRGWGVEGALLALGAGSAAGSLVLLRGFLAEAAPGAARLERERIGAGRVARYSLPLVGRSFLGQIVWRQSEALIVGYWWGAAMAGQFNLGYNFPQRVLEFVPLAIWPLVLAGLSEVEYRKRENLPRAISLYYKFLFLLVVPLAFFGVTLGDRVVVLLYGPEMVQAGTLARLFFVVFVIAFLGTPLHMATYVVEKTWANLAVGLVGAAVTLGLDLLLIPKYGVLGGVPPTAVGLVVSNSLQYALAKRYVPGLAIPWRHFLRVSLASCAILAVYPARPLTGSPAGLAAACLGCAALFVLSARLLRVLGEEEREVLAGRRELRILARLL